MKLSNVIASVPSGTYLSTFSVSLSCPDAIDNLQTQDAVSPPSYKTGSGSCVIGDYAYIFSGYNSSNTLTTACYKLNLLTNEYTQIANIPTARRSFVCVLNKNGKINVISGSTNPSLNADYTQKNEEYDPNTNTWSTKADIPVSSEGTVGLAASNGKIYCIGGYRPGGATYGTYQYDCDLDSWSTKAICNFNIFGAVAEEYNSKMYMFGGGSSGYEKKISVYDFVNNTWDYTKADIPDSGKNSSTGFYGKIANKMYIGGGIISPNNTYSYDFANNTWSTALSTHDNYSMSFCSVCVVYGNAIIYSLGLSNSAFYDKILKFVIGVPLKVRYTTDGNNPTALSTEYTSPIAINLNTTLKAIAISD